MEINVEDCEEKDKNRQALGKRMEKYKNLEAEIKYLSSY